ncbi:MAG: glutamate 5-kinase [Alphaproteobacteria bacterium]|nr:glutamate 5-kinase [Alphaproteobacteria bacterium]
MKQKNKNQTANAVTLLQQAKLVIIKIGSALLVQRDESQRNESQRTAAQRDESQRDESQRDESQRGAPQRDESQRGEPHVEAGQDILDKAWMQALSADIAAAHKRGQHIVLVSSGAVALGRGVLGLDENRLTLEQSQAAAAAGQIALGAAWQDALGAFDLTTAQILLTPDDTERRRNYLNARSTLNTLLSLGVVPIINENDTVATQEIRYGDNDRLAARVASMLSADCLVLFSDIDGLYTQDPHLASIKHSPQPILPKLNS